MKRILFVVISIMCIGLISQAQNFSYKLNATEVKFSGSGYISIRQDSTAAIYNIAHWRSTGLREPAAWVSGSTMSVTAKFEFLCSNAPDSISIRGIGADSISFPIKTVALTASSGVYNCTYPITIASKSFNSGIIKYYAPFNIFWEVSFDHGLNWRRADTTDHKVYVTKSAPMVETTNFKYFHTILELSCLNAQGQTNDSIIIQKCWEEFLDHLVFNYKGDSLFYYKTFNTSNTSLPSLLKARNAQCFTFAQLFLAMIKIQGINKTNNYINFTPKKISNSCGGTINRFLVKNWKLVNKSDSVACPSFPYKNTFTGSYLTSTGYVFATADATDQTGVWGVCNPNPASFFNNHQIAKIDGIYYDACYGLTYSSIAEIKVKGIDAFAAQNAPGTYNFSTDMSVDDFSESISTY